MLVVEKFPGANTRRGDEGRRGSARRAGARRCPACRPTRPSSGRPTFIEDAIDNLTLAVVIAAILLALVARGLPVPVADRADRARHDSACRSSPRRSCSTCWARRFNAISFAGLAVGARGGDRRRGRRRRERRPAAAPAVARPGATCRSRRSWSTRRTRCAARWRYATLIVLLAIVPVAVMEGRPGAFFEPLALVVRARRRGRDGRRAHAHAGAQPDAVLARRPPGGRSRRWSRRAAAALRRRALALRPHAATGADRRGRHALVAASPRCRCSTRPSIPSFKDRDVLVRLDSEPGTSNPRMTQITTQLSREAARHPRRRQRRRARRAARSGGPGRETSTPSEVWVSIDSGADYDATLASIEDAVDRVRSAVDHDVVTYTTQKIQDVGALSEGENPVTGDGPRRADRLRQAARRARVRPGPATSSRRAGRPGCSELVSRGRRRRRPAPRAAGRRSRTVEIEVDLDKARNASGSSPATCAARRPALLQGIEVGSVFEDQKVFEVIVKGTPDDPPQRGERAQPADRPAGRRSRPPRRASPTCASRRPRP